MQVSASVLTASVGGSVGPTGVHHAVLDAVRSGVADARASGLLIDGFTTRCGSRLAVIVTHTRSQRSLMAWARKVFADAASVGVDLGQYGALEASAHNGSLPVEAVELPLDVGDAEPLLVFLSAGAAPGSWNVPLYRMFADPFVAPRLLHDLSVGFSFSMGSRTTFDLPDDTYRLLAEVSHGGCIRSVRLREAAAATAAAAGSGSDPALIVRCGRDGASVGDCLEALALPGTGLFPVAAHDDALTRSGVPPRIIGLGFQLADGRLVGPRDLLADAAFDDARRRALSERIAPPLTPVPLRTLATS